MKKENTQPKEAKKTTKKVGRPKGRKTAKKEREIEILDFDVPTRSNLDEFKEESEIERLKAELAEAKEEVDKMSMRLHKKIRTYDRCIGILMEECNWLMDEVSWYKKCPKKFKKKAIQFKNDFLEEYTKVGLAGLLRKLLEE